MTVFHYLEALVVMEQEYRQKAVFDDVFRAAFELCAEFCAYHREILETNCGAFLEKEISESQAAELSHEIIESSRVEMIFGA